MSEVLLQKEYDSNQNQNAWRHESKRKNKYISKSKQILVL